MSEPGSPLSQGIRLTDWAGAIAAPTPSPAGGAAAAISGALAAAVVEMVAGMTASRERYASVHERAAEMRARAASLRERLLQLAARDAEVFAGFERALALPRETEAERASRREAKQAALLEGTRVQLEVLECTAELADLGAWLAGDGLATAIGDSAAAGFLSAGVARSAYWAVRSNLQDVEPHGRAADGRARGLELLERAEAAEWRIRQLLSERVR